ncbi:MAG TPA: DUF3450 domain-containing protein [Candidatus Krumholzibacteria bacterium]|nr:DUF3450 domain-containing protein [Candidatus Krumholzibacteria bacterium]
MTIRTATLVAVTTTLVVTVSIASRAQEAKKLGETVDKTVGTYQATQQKQDDWATEQAALVARYRTAQANVEYLEKRESYEESEVSALENNIAELERRLLESTRLNESLQDTLNAVVGRLETFVARDIPFLVDERAARVAAIKEEIARPDVTGAEKLRRVLEALQVEANYGNTVEVYQEQVTVGDEAIFADMLQIGRVSVYWRTPDGKRVGEYDRASGAWLELDGKYARSINMTVDMATRIRPTEIVTLPIGRIQP